MWVSRLKNVRRTLRGIVGVGMDVDNGSWRKDVQPGRAQGLGDIMRLHQIVCGRHADVSHDVDRPPGVPDPKVVHVIEPLDALGGVFELVPDLRVAVVEEAEHDVAARLAGGPGDEKTDEEAEGGIDARFTRHDPESGGNDAQRREPVCARVLAIGHKGRAADPLPRAGLVLGHGLVPHKADQSGQQDQPCPLEFPLFANSPEGFEQDECGTPGNQEDDHEPRKVFDAVEPIAKAVILLAPGDEEGDPDDAGAEDVDAVVQRVAKEGNGTAQEKQPRLQGGGETEAGNTDFEGTNPVSRREIEGRAVRMTVTMSVRRFHAPIREAFLPVHQEGNYSPPQLRLTVRATGCQPRPAAWLVW